MQVTALSLHTHRLAEVCDFYAQVLGVPVREQGGSQITLQCGSSTLQFLEGEAAYYHFAINISPDQLHRAADWLREKGIPLLPMDGQDIVPFPNWDAEAIYFYDPAGNIVEFIARHRLPRSGRPIFGIDDLLSISEIGLPTHHFQEVKSFVETQLGLPIFGNPSPVFAALGDDHGLWILVDAAEKRWIPNMEPALPFPLEARVQVEGTTWDLVFAHGKLMSKFSQEG
jgi:catechol-2,3-dioxygenase